MSRLALVVVSAVAAVALLALSLRDALRPPRLPVPDRRDWVFRDVTLVEPGRPARTGRTLRIVDGRIAADAEPGPAAAVASEAPDLAGLFVAPGLVDMHVHYPPALAVGNAELWSLLLLAHGVTSVRETGSIDGSVFAVRRAIRAGAFPGPRLFACGAMLDGERPSFPSNRVVRTAAEARAAVEEQATRGADCIKAYNMLTPEALAAIRLAASRAGLPLIGHAPHSVSLEEAGLVDLQHGTGAVLIDPETVGRMDFQFEDWDTVDAARIAHVARVSRAQGIAHTPTLVNGRLRALLANGGRDEALQNDTGLRHLPRFWSGVWATLWGRPYTPGDAESEAVFRRFRAHQAELTVRLHHAGVRIHAGTDTLMPFVAPGSSLHGELADLAEAGIAPEAVWRIATREAGESLGVPGLGTLAVGAPADLLFLRSDPRGDLAALAGAEAVLAAGRLYRRADFDAALARFDAHFHGWLYETVVGGAVHLLQGTFAPEDDA